MGKGKAQGEKVAATTNQTNGTTLDYFLVHAVSVVSKEIDLAERRLSWVFGVASDYP